MPLLQIRGRGAVPSCVVGILAKRRRGVPAAKPHWTQLGGHTGPGDEDSATYRTRNPAARHNKLLVRQGKLGGDAATRVYLVTTTCVVTADQRDPGL
jgi:hypothetical protein